LAEISKALSKKIKLPARTIKEILAWLKDSASILQPTQMSFDMCRDKNDLHVLGLAFAANADFLVTGDEDLLVLRETFTKTAIVTPRQFWERMRKLR
jgi:putative PIN family toxin of toxin-antitoxin system